MGGFGAGVMTTGRTMVAVFFAATGRGHDRKVLGRDSSLHDIAGQQARTCRGERSNGPEVVPSGMSTSIAPGRLMRHAGIRCRRRTIGRRNANLQIGVVGFA